MTLEGRGVIVVLHLADVSAVEGVPQKLFCVKVAKYETQKPLTCRATLFRCKFWVDVSRFFTLCDQLVADRPFATNDHMVHGGGQAHYYSRSGTSKQRDLSQ